MARLWKWNIGSHIGFDAGIHAVIRDGIRYDMQSIQFFMGSPQQYKRRQISDGDIKTANTILSDREMSVFTHFPYVANLCGSKASLAWNGDSEQDRKTRAVLNGLEYELNTVAKLKTVRSGVVIHAGNYTDTTIGLAKIAESINKINFEPNSKLILENTAGQGTSLCRTLKEIKEIINQVDKKNHIGVCIDTCHLFAYGDYDFRKVDEVDRFFVDFDDVLGIDRFTLLHLNDSQTKIGSKVDRHAPLMEGEIWTNNSESLIHLLNLCKEFKIPMILETGGNDIEMLKLFQ